MSWQQFGEYVHLAKNAQRTPEEHHVVCPRGNQVHHRVRRQGTDQQYLSRELDELMQGRRLTPYRAQCPIDMCSTDCGHLLPFTTLARMKPRHGGLVGSLELLKGVQVLAAMISMMPVHHFQYQRVVDV